MSRKRAKTELGRELRCVDDSLEEIKLMVDVRELDKALLRVENLRRSIVALQQLEEQ